jgi:hypothetical protein
LHIVRIVRTQDAVDGFVGLDPLKVGSVGKGAVLYG